MLPERQHDLQMAQMEQQDRQQERLIRSSIRSATELQDLMTYLNLSHKGFGGEAPTSRAQS